MYILTIGMVNNSTNAAASVVDNDSLVAFLNPDEGILCASTATNAAMINMVPGKYSGEDDADMDVPKTDGQPSFKLCKYGPMPKRSEEHTSELQSLMRISYAVFCLKKKKTKQPPTT